MRAVDTWRNPHQLPSLAALEHKVIPYQLGQTLLVSGLTARPRNRYLKLVAATGIRHHVDFLQQELTATCTT